MGVWLQDADFAFYFHGTGGWGGMRGWGPFLWTQTPLDELDGDQELRCHPVPPPRSQSPHVNGLSREGLFEAQASSSPCLVLCERCRSLS